MVKPRRKKYRTFSFKNLTIEPLAIFKMHWILLPNRRTFSTLRKSLFLPRVLPCSPFNKLNRLTYFSCFEEWEQKTNQRKYQIFSQMKPKRKKLCYCLWQYREILLRNLNIKPFSILKIHEILLFIQRTFLYVWKTFIPTAESSYCTVQPFQRKVFLKGTVSRDRYFFWRS